MGHRDEFGDTDMLVRTVEQGRSLARALGARRVVLMRGHGSAVAGGNLREIVMTCVYMEQNARLQAQAMALGETQLPERPRDRTDGPDRSIRSAASAPGTSGASARA